MIVAEKYGYEYFDDPISDARFEQQMFINRSWYRKQLLEALGGTGRSDDFQEAIAEIRESVIGDETLEVIFMMYQPFILHTSEEGFYAVDCIEENNTSKISLYVPRRIHET